MIKERFWKKVKIGKKNDCWDWEGTKQNKGYGRIKIGRKLYLSHRISYELTYGKIPDGLWVLHKCDNPACVNPKHLFLGNRSDNMKDCYDKERSPKQKLNLKKVKEIRVLIKKGLTSYKIAKRYNVDEKNIRDIRDKKIWNR